MLLYKVKHMGSFPWVGTMILPFGGACYQLVLLNNLLSFPALDTIVSQKTLVCNKEETHSH